MVDFTPEEQLRQLQILNDVAPQSRALGIEITRADGMTTWAKVPYREDLIGDPDTRVIAGGVVTTFLDQICGLAAILKTKDPTLVATIDLRIDYMRAAEPGRDIQAEAACVRLTRSVAFVRATAYEDSPDNPIAHASATFMINGPRRATEAAS